MQWVTRAYKWFSRDRRQARRGLPLLIRVAAFATFIGVVLVVVIPFYPNDDRYVVSLLWLLGLNLVGWVLGFAAHDAVLALGRRRVS